MIGNEASDDPALINTLFPSGLKLHAVELAYRICKENQMVAVKNLFSLLPLMSSNPT